LANVNTSYPTAPPSQGPTCPETHPLPLPRRLQNQTDPGPLCPPQKIFGKIAPTG